MMKRNSKAAKKKKPKPTPQSALITTLPHDVLFQCLARFSRLYYPTLSLVSKSFQSLLASPELYQFRSLLGYTESCLYVCIRRHGYFLIKAPVPCNRYADFSNLVAVGSDIYTIGKSASSSRVSVLDCTSHTWRHGPSLPVKLQSLTASVIDRKIYVAGCSRDGDSFTNSFHVLDTTTQIWDDPEPIPCREAKETFLRSKSASLEGKFHVITLRRLLTIPRKLYMELGNFGFAEKVFDIMPERDISSFNTMIVCYAKKGFSLEALELYYKMVGYYGIEPDEYAVLGLLLCCGQLPDVRLGKGVHGWIERRRLCSSSSNLILSNAVLDMYFKCKESGLAKRAFDVMMNKDMRSWNIMVGGFVKLGDMEAAQAVFDQMPRRDLVSWNSLMFGYSRKGWDQRAVRELFYEMLIVENIIPDSVTMVSLISGAADNGELNQGRWIHGLATRLRLQIDAFLGSALVDMYCKCGAIERAFMVFKTVSEKDVTLWTTMITGFAFHGHGKQALQLFEEMQEQGVTPNKVTLLAVLTACSHSGLVEEGLHVFNNMKEKFGFEPETEHYGSLVDMLCRAGRVEEAKDIVQKKMPMRPSQAMWGSILSACRGGEEDIETAEMALTELLKLEPEKEGGYVLLSNIYASVGRFGYSDKTREAMESRGVKKIAGYSCVVGVDGINSFVATEKQNHPRWLEIRGILHQLCDEMKSKLDVLNLLGT
ncbi:hypothetical protein AALP_AA3G042400 [Arabis alpina]|uniref:F-box domain-containing protein n=1 Tax=Arabis alpina TaxID=50452 RepID=A0A087H6Y7_ARAAL|nr:hypothetical protein AALP_AA3G042400 [Arabis alpina]